MTNRFRGLTADKQLFKKLTICVVLIAALILLPFFIPTSYFRGVVTKTLLSILLAASMNAINGYSGQFTVGQMGFACIGAFVTAILMKNFGLSFWAALLISGVVASLFGALISLPVHKMSGLYLTIVTLGFSEIIRLVALNWVSVTGGPLGIKNIPKPNFFGFAFKTSSTFAWYYLILAFVIIMYFCTASVIHSKIGRAWIAIRENEHAAAALGIKTHVYKTINFAYGAFWAGIAGSFMSIYYGFMDSSYFTMSANFDLLAMTIIGGLGTLSGPFVGAIAVNIIMEVFRGSAEYRNVIYGALIIVMLWVRPQGLMGVNQDGRRISFLKSKRNRASKDGGAV